MIVNSDLEHFDVVHVGLPVLDVAAVVAGDHPLVVVRPDHGAHRRVVRLQDRLEVEGEPVPERELAARRARDEAAPLGRPGQREDGAPHLVGRRLHELGRHRVGRVVAVGDRGQELHACMG